MTPNLLLVEDDKAAQFALSELLGEMGATVLLAQSGEDALRLVLKHEFAAILLDVRLPGMDGYEVAAAIRTLERTRRTPIIFMSAEDDRRTVLRDGAAETYLRKPLEPDVLLPTLAHLLGSNRA
jgi:CheY-like chemotaxis protein